MQELEPFFNKEYVQKMTFESDAKNIEQATQQSNELSTELIKLDRFYKFYYYKLSKIEQQNNNTDKKNVYNMYINNIIDRAYLLAEQYFNLYLKYPKLRRDYRKLSKGPLELDVLSPYVTNKLEIDQRPSFIKFYDARHPLTANSFDLTIPKVAEFFKEQRGGKIFVGGSKQKKTKQHKKYKTHKKKLTKHK